MDQDYKKKFTSFENLKRTYHLILDELRKIKREIPDITIAEHDKLKKEIAEKGNTIFHLTQENSDINQSLVNQQAEITDLTTNLTDITNQRNLLQTEKNNLQVELQNKENELNSQRINLTLEKDQESKKVLETIINELGIKVKEITTEEVIAEIKNLLTPPNPNDDIIFTKNQEINELKSELMTIKTN